MRWWNGRVGGWWTKQDYITGPGSPGAGVRVYGERGRVCLEEDTDRQTDETIPDLELQQNRTELLFRAGGIGIIRYSQVHRFILRQKTALRAVVVR